jgi:hypothetical protein
MTTVDHALLSELTADDARLDALEATDAATDTRLDALEGNSPGWVNAKAAPYNAVGDGVADDTAALTAALAAARLSGRRLYIPAGTYKVTATLTGSEKTPLDVVGDGMGRTTLLHQIPGAPMFGLLGTLGTNKALTNAPASGTSVLQVASTTGWAAGDILVLRDASQPVYGDTARTAEAATGELRRVKTVDSATQVTLRGRLENSYTATNTLVAKLSPVEGRVADLTITNPAPGTLPTTSRGLLAAYGKNVRVERVEFVDFDAAQIYLQTVAGFRVSDCRFQDARDLEQATNPYNIIATNGASHGLVSGCRGWYGRHLFTTGAAATEPPAQHIRVSDCIATEYTQAAFDTHPGSKWITFADCEAHGNAREGFQIRGTDSQVVNPTVSQATFGVAVIYGADRCRVSGGRLSRCDSGVLIESADDCYDIWDDQFVVRNWRAPDASTKVTGSPTTPSVTGTFQDAFAGGIAPSAPGVAGASLTLVANQAHLSRYVPERNMTITKLAYIVTTVAGSDDPVDVAIYSLNPSAGVLSRLNSLGATVGQLNSLGRKVLTIPATRLVAGTIYYIGLSCGVIGTTAAVILGAGYNSTTAAGLMGTGVPDLITGSKPASHPLPPTISGPSALANGPRIGVLE